LALPLGKWYTQMQPQGWYYHPDTNSLWLRTPTQWLQHGGIPQQMQQHNLHDHGKVTHPPPMNELNKATTATCGQKILLTDFETCKKVDCNQDFCQTMLTTDFSTQWGLTLQLIRAQRALQGTIVG